VRFLVGEMIGHIKFSVPEGLSFLDLHLRWNDEGHILFDWAAIDRLCEASGIDSGLIRRSGADNVARLINQWYLVHRSNGGAIDLVKEEAMSYAIPDAPYNCHSFMFH